MSSTNGHSRPTRVEPLCGSTREFNDKKCAHLPLNSTMEVLTSRTMSTEPQDFPENWRSETCSDGETHALMLATVTKRRYRTRRRTRRRRLRRTNRCLPCLFSLCTVTGVWGNEKSAATLLHICTSKNLKFEWDFRFESEFCINWGVWIGVLHHSDT